MATDIYNQGNIRELLQDAIQRPVSPQLAWKYTQRKDFPEPLMVKPHKLWTSDVIWDWINNLVAGRGNRSELESTHTSKDPMRGQIRAFIESQGRIKRDPAYWDHNLTANENRRAFGFMDTIHGGQMPDDIATQIYNMFPESGITDADSLINYLGGN